LINRFNIGKSQAASIIKDKLNIQSMWKSGDWNIDVKRKYLNEKGLKLDAICFEWFLKTQSENPMSISGPAIQAKAKEVATSLGIPDFAASNGWLQKWRTRHNISFRSISGRNISGSQYNDDRLSPLLIPKCETILTEEDTVEFENPVANKIDSDESALKIILRLKQYLKDDYIAFEHLKNLESYVQNRISENQP
ncbi:hypothetical protein KR044_006749, partial [Drosophila immigrans]